MKFILFHGSFGHPEEHWIPALKESLLALGQEVIVPQFPCDDWDEVCAAGENAPAKRQNLQNWLQVFEKEVLPKINKDDKLCFVGHSIAPLFILHVVTKFDITLDSAIFASPFLDDIGGKYWQFKTVNKTFYEHTFDYKKLRKRIPVSYVVYSDNDPYVGKKFFLDFGKKMHSSMIMVKRAGHLSASANLNEFPLILELCKSRLDLNLYQKYLAHRRELFGIDYIKPSEEVIYLKADEVFDEGIFKFRNLKTHGFCTFFTKLPFWDTQSIYMSSSRQAAHRMKDLSRVFVVDDFKDLERPLLMEQIKLDLASEVKVYFMMRKDLDKITTEPDFGIWDYEYLCTVSTQDNQATLSSRKEDIEKGKKWEEEILKVATRITNVEQDLQEFIKKHRV